MKENGEGAEEGSGMKEGVDGGTRGRCGDGDGE